MGLKFPYKRNCRCFVDNNYTEGGRSRYILHPEYAESPEHYIRAYLLIQKDLQSLFDYIEPSDTNLKTYSYRIHELLIRSCIEIEANFKAILRENGYKVTSHDWNIIDYKKLNGTHRLSSYEVKLPYWKGTEFIRKPFARFATNGTPLWYDAYNDVKHDRSFKFENANFEHLIDAVSGLVVLLSSQFHCEDFTSDVCYRVCGRPNDGMESAIGEYFRVKFPTDWADDEKYDFDWSQMSEEDKKFNRLFNNEKTLLTAKYTNHTKKKQ